MEKVLNSVTTTKKFKTASPKVEAITLQTRIPSIYFIINENPPHQNSITKFLWCQTRSQIIMYS